MRYNRHALYYMQDVLQSEQERVHWMLKEEDLTEDDREELLDEKFKIAEAMSIVNELLVS